MAYTFVFPSAAQMDKIEADLANRGKEEIGRAHV